MPTDTDNNLKTQVSKAFRSKSVTSSFGELVQKLDHHTQIVHFEMMEERGIKEEKLTYEERIVFVTKLVHQLQSCEFHYQGKNSYSEKAVQFFEKNDIRRWGQCIKQTLLIGTRGSN